MSKIKGKKVDIREIVYSQDDEKSFGDIFVYEPENIEEQNLGNLFIVGELKDLPRNCAYIINLLASKIKKEFYSDTKRSAEESLEAALGEANKTLSEIADQGNGEYVGKLSMVCGTYRGSRFYLSQAGKIKSLLIRDGQLMEIVRTDTLKAVSPKRVFNDIASGDLNDGDVILFATIGLFNIFSLEEIRQVGSSSDLDEFSVKLQEEIEEDDNEIVSALIMKIGGEKKAALNRIGIAEEFSAPQENKVEKGSESEEEVYDAFVEEESEKGFEESEDIPGTEEDSSGIPEAAPLSMEREEEPGARREDSGSAEDISAGNERIGAEKEGMSVPVANEAVADSLPSSGAKMSLSDVIREYEKMENRTMEYVPEKDAGNIEEVIGRKEASGFEDLDEKEEPLHKKIVSKTKDVFGGVKLGKAKSVIAQGAKKALQRQDKKEYRINEKGRKLRFVFSKKFLLASAVLIAVFAGTYYFGGSKGQDNGEEKMASYQSMLADSRSKMEQAEVELISGSKGNAGKLFVEARNLALKVKNEYDGLDSEAEQIISGAQAEIDKIDLVSSVGNFQVLASFENDNIKDMAGIAGNYYLVDGKENSVYKVDSKEGKIVQLAKAGSGIGTIISAESFQNQEILLSNGTDFLDFGLKNNILQKMNSKADSAAQDVAAYGRFVYLLSPTQNQIYKYQKNSLTFDGKTEWLKNGDIRNAVSFAIDEYIYILTSDGQVKKYLTGSEYLDQAGNKFTIKQPSEQISNPAEIYTSTDQKNLYITEPGKGRILIFDKTSGNLVKQLTDESFSDLRAIYVDAEEENLIALVKGKVLKISLGE